MQSSRNRLRHAWRDREGDSLGRVEQQLGAKMLQEEGRQGTTWEVTQGCDDRKSPLPIAFRASHAFYLEHSFPDVHVSI